MKKIITLITLVLSINFAQAQGLSAHSMQELVEQIEKAEFTYKGRATLFSYVSTQSCLYASEDLVIFKNYCFPEREYPAKGYTILSKSLGMIDLYEEQLSGQINKRDIQITQFPEVMTTYLTTPLHQMTLKGLDAMMEKMYRQFYPACWSTNYSQYEERAVAACNVAVENVGQFSQWATDTQSITADPTAWKALLKFIDSKIQ